MKVLRKELSSTFLRCCLLWLYKVVLSFESADETFKFNFPFKAKRQCLESFLIGCFILSIFQVVLSVPLVRV